MRIATEIYVQQTWYLVNYSYTKFTRVLGLKFNTKIEIFHIKDMKDKLFMSHKISLVSINIRK